MLTSVFLPRVLMPSCIFANSTESHRVHINDIYIYLFTAFNQHMETTIKEVLCLSKQPLEENSLRKEISSAL